MPNPPFNNARGAANQVGEPPFNFSGTIMRMFPLRANMANLRVLCDSYLNRATEIVRFEPAGPFVFLQMIDYGEMSSEVFNAGWVAQNELLFAVPLVRYDVEDGEEVFKGFATVCPFIYVDQAESQATGREVYGWPKVFGKLEPGLSAWVRSPTDPLTLFRMSAQVIVNAGAVSFEPLVEISQKKPTRFVQFPPTAETPLNPLFDALTALSGSASVAMSAARTMSSLGTEDSGSEPNLELLKSLSNLLGGIDPMARPSATLVNLKQFRDPRRLERACYQAITTSQNVFTQVNRGGLLGETHQLRGDVTGGYRIGIYRHASQPIIESLGLQVSEERHSARGTKLAILEPLFPSWIDVNFRYSEGKVVCWRTYTGGWQVPDTAGSRPIPAATPSIPFYSLAGGGSSEEIPGPFLAPRATLRVLPLLATPKKLRKFCDHYLNGERKDSAAGGQHRKYDLPRGTNFKPWGRYVYLVAENFDELSLGSEILGLGAQRRASFLIPIRWYEHKKLVSVGILRAYMYSESDIATTTGREVRGWPIQLAKLKRPKDHWLDADAPQDYSQNLLELSTPVLPALGVGERVQDRTLLEVTTRPILAADETSQWQSVAAEWGEALFEELERKQRIKDTESENFRRAKALALQVMAEGRPINDVALRQFRDVEHPQLACYQGISFTPTVVEALTDLQEMVGSVHLGIHRYASEPIVDTLGLVVKTTSHNADGIIDWLQPVRPFWAKADFKTRLTRELFYRVHSERWVETPTPFHDRSGKGAHEVETERKPYLGESILDFISERDLERHLRQAVVAWKDQAPEPRHMTFDEAADAVEHIDPQPILESILSSSWANQGLPRWWRRRSEEDKEPRPDFCIPDDSVGPGEVKRAFEKLHDLQDLQDYWHLRPRKAGGTKRHRKKAPESQ